MNDKQNPVLLWFRRDLRLSDNPALTAAISSGRPVHAIYVLDDESAGQWALGGASRWWLHKSLTALSNDLEEKGIRLILRKGRADEIIPALAKETATKTVYWNRQYDPSALQRDERIEALLQSGGVDVVSRNGSLLVEPWVPKTRNGGPFRVFTPFWNWMKETADPDQPTRAPLTKCSRPRPAETERLESWELSPSSPNWSVGLEEMWTPGEAGARRRLESFLRNAIGDYAERRDRPDVVSTSRLSPHLAFGEISPRQVWHSARRASNRKTVSAKKADIWKFLSELAWREFSYHLLYHYPTLPTDPWRSSFTDFPWNDDDNAFDRWCKGQTGYPIIDAGMRELWRTGWMHNRVRMITASFLVKDLMIPWQRGEAWFWDTLVDADLASNAQGWQWVAGSGADAAPFFRIFNPVIQGEKFDPNGTYVRRWVPEISALPDRFIHKPWQAPDEIRSTAGVQLGSDYPHPMVDHAKARSHALKAYESIKK